MQTSLFRRGISLALSLATALSLGLTARAAEADGLCGHHPTHTTDCGYEATGQCTHECTADSGCITIRCTHTHVATCFDTEGNSLCRHACTDTPACYTPTVSCIHSTHGSCGHSEGQDCDFALSGCPQCQAAEAPVSLKGTDVVLTDGTEYTCTGQEIKPHVTVMVDRTVLVENEHYTVTYTNNIDVGSAMVTVTGLEAGGYTGTVEIPFTIHAAPQDPTEPEIPTEPETPTEPSQPSDPTGPSQPTEPSQPSDPTEPSQPEEDQEEKPFDYKIVKGSGGKWRQDSGKNLSFVINADTDDITAIRINGKKLNHRHYTLKKDVITLKESWLQEQELGTYRITVEFEDGDAQGKFIILRAADESNPKTGDTIGLWAALMGISLTGAAALLILGRKKIFK